MKAIKRKYQWPRKSPPHFALPGHEWMTADSLTDGETIRSIDGWKLVRRKRHKVSANVAEERLKHPGQGMIGCLAKKFHWPPKLKRAMIANQVLDSLATFIENKVAQERDFKEREKNRGLCAVSPRNEHQAEREIIEDAEMLHYLVSKGCRSLMEIAKKSPEIIRPIARKQKDWPLLMSRHPGFSVKHLDFLATLEQGDQADGVIIPMDSATFRPTCWKWWRLQRVAI